MALLAFAALAIATFLPVRRPAESWGIFASIPRLVLITALVWTALGVAIALPVTLLLDPARMDGSVLATIRTAVLVTATLALARAARHTSGLEAGWLVYPLIVLTGMKLVFVDFPQGRPQTLFAALALYGFALIAAPRMLRRTTPPVPTAAPIGQIESPRASTQTLPDQEGTQPASMWKRNEASFAPL